MRIKIAIILIVLPSLVLSQGMYLNKGQSGLGATVGFGTNEDLNLLLAGIGYSYGGVVDIGLAYGRGISKEEPTVTMNNFLPSIAIHLIKQTKKLPISLAASGGYLIGNSKSDLFDLYDVTVKNSGFSIGGYVYSEIVLSGFSIIPTIGFEYLSVTVKLEDAYGNSIDEDDTNTTFNFNLPIVFRLDSNKFSLSPGIGIDENNTSFVMSLIFIIPN